MKQRHSHDEADEPGQDQRDDLLEAAIGAERVPALALRTSGVFKRCVPDHARETVPGGHSDLDLASPIRLSGQGICDDVITAPYKMRWLFVIARNSTSPLKGRAIHLPDPGSDAAATGRFTRVMPSKSVYLSKF
jgi:hypothetical protein